MLPLEGVRILDFTWAMAGPQATRLLADLGADVLKVESIERLDLARSAFGPFPHGREAFGPNSSGYFNHFNRNKRSIALNMATAEAREVVAELVPHCDAVIENFSAGVLEAWGFGYERLRELRPDVVYVSMAGPGHRGPYSDQRTFGPTVQALSGLTHLSGFPDAEPAGWGFSYMDHSGGYAAATAVLIALWQRTRTGRGEHVDLSQIEAAVTLTGTAILDYQVNGRRSSRTGNRSAHPAVAPHGIYRCADEDELDRWVAVACYTDEQWDALARELGVDGHSSVLERLAAQDELDRIIEAWTRPQLAHDVQRRLQRVGVPAAAVQNNRDLIERDEQAAHRGTYPAITHSLLGTYRTDDLPIRLSDTPGGIRHAAPLLGQDTDEVLMKLLGCTPERIAELRAAGALR